MSVRIDTSEVRALAARIPANAVKVAAMGSALVRKTAFDIEADAKALAPVDTGALQSSISTTISGSTTLTTAEIGPTVEYGIYQEYGTSTQPGTPFMGPAADRRIPVFEQGLAALGTELI